MYRPLELGQRQHLAEHRAARLQHPARPQAAQPDRVVADPVGQVRDRGDRRAVVDLSWPAKRTLPRLYSYA